jgi:hypothetical protein
MKRLFAAALVLAASPAALAHDPPPPVRPQDAPAPTAPAAPTTPTTPTTPPTAPAKPARHENKISPEAKALFAKFKKLAYSAVDHGLKDLSGTVRMEMQAAGAESGGMAGMQPMGLEWSLTFKLPREIELKNKGEGSPIIPPQHQAQMRDAVKAVISRMFGFFVPGDDEEFDAEVVSTDGKTTLVVTVYKGETKLSVTETAVSELGLPGSFVATVTAAAGAGAMANMRSEGKFLFEKEGEKFRFSGMDVTSPNPVEMRVVWGEVGGFKLATKWAMKVDTPMGKMTLAYAFADLTINGKAVDLPKPAPTGTATPKDGATPPAPGTPPAGGGLEEEMERAKKLAEEMRKKYGGGEKKEGEDEEKEGDE